MKKCVTKFEPEQLLGAVKEYLITNLNHYSQESYWCTNLFIFSTGVQCHDRVLLGTIPGGVEFWCKNNRWPKAEDIKGGFSSQTCQTLARCWFPCIQHICLVDEWL